MKYLFDSFRTINRNLAMIWPPFVTLLVLLGSLMLILFLFVSSVLGDLFRGFNPFRASDMERFLLSLGLPGQAPDQVFAIMILLFAAGMMMELVISSFVWGGLYQMSASVLNGQKNVWSAFGKGGIRYLGWGILYFILLGISTWVVMFLVGFPFVLLAGMSGSENGLPFFAFVAMYLPMIAVQYLYALFYPALIDGQEGFGRALLTSFRYSWKLFLKTVLPGILLVIGVFIVYFAFIGIGYITHPLVTFLLFIPSALYLTPVVPIWFTLIYRDLTDPFRKENEAFASFLNH